jgi:lysozyme
MRIPPKAIAAMGAGVIALASTGIKAHEGYVPQGYVDPIGVKTRCWGNTSPGIIVGERYSREQCERLLVIDVQEHADRIRPCVPAGTPIQSQAAFLSFAFNVGPKAFCGSTMARKLKAGDLAGACAELSRWTYAGGKQWKGLVRRRADERALCEKGIA